MNFSLQIVSSISFSLGFNSYCRMYCCENELYTTQIWLWLFTFARSTEDHEIKISLWFHSSLVLLSSNCWLSFYACLDIDQLNLGLRHTHKKPSLLFLVYVFLWFSFVCPLRIHKHRGIRWLLPSLFIISPPSIETHKHLALLIVRFCSFSFCILQWTIAVCGQQQPFLFLSLARTGRHILSLCYLLIHTVCAPGVHTGTGHCVRLCPEVRVGMWEWDTGLTTILHCGRRKKTQSDWIICPHRRKMTLLF